MVLFQITLQPHRATKTAVCTRLIVMRMIADIAARKIGGEIAMKMDQTNRVLTRLVMQVQPVIDIAAVVTNVRPED